MRVSVIGGSSVPEHLAAIAQDVGQLLAERNHTVVCGGLGGVMEAVAAGAQAADGSVLGILPGTDRTSANEFVDTAIVTGLGHGRNHLVVSNGEAVIAIDGGGGTLSELGFAHVYDRPTAALGRHEIEGLDHVEHVADAAGAVDYIEEEVN
jgi:uncharacterized protein (TIGR00725 family)